MSETRLNDSFRLLDAGMTFYAQKKAPTDERSSALTPWASR